MKLRQTKDGDEIFAGNLVIGMMFIAGYIETMNVYF